MKITDLDMFESLEFLRDDSRVVSNARARRTFCLLASFDRLDLL